jgi:gamma-glutamylcyclotransferase (GGCT)/AIG2-like uncharacterized protein YtfP
MRTSTTTLFAYGTLLLDEVVHALTDRTFRTLPARLHGYRRHTIIRHGNEMCEAYPAIQPSPVGIVVGRLLLEVDEHSLKLIECFESDPPDYERTPVEVQIDGGAKTQAITYVAHPSLSACLKGEWYLEVFARNHLQDYLTRVIPEMRRQAG